MILNENYGKNDSEKLTEKILTKTLFSCYISEVQGEVIVMKIQLRTFKRKFPAESRKFLQQKSHTDILVKIVLLEFLAQSAAVDSHDSCSLGLVASGILHHYIKERSLNLVHNKIVQIIKLLLAWNLV